MPWCVRKCPYCDFNSHQLKSAAPDASYIDMLIRDFDAELPRLKGRRIDTVFFGGGTPSLFQPEDFSRLLGALRQRIAFSHGVEITMEANPGTIERGRFAGYREAGINRVSLGAQSFAPRALEVLGRIHSADDTHRAVTELRAAKLDNFNLDLMYALPEQTLEEAFRDVEIACALSPAHISYYQLTLEPGTVFHTRPPQREGARCRHNLNYWLFGDYLGIGAGAHGKISFALPQRILRTVKPKQPREYQEQVLRASPGAAIGESAYIVPKDLPFEFMLNALRLNEGFTIHDYRRQTGLGIESVLAELAEGERRGLLAQEADAWRPTELGRRFLNDLQASFLA
jgi:oxygen-independent coproporphyrinogen-3 oxidase